jgi:6-pyruvoyltetrahydropterin/6-carboxytetrahydropterin synthase
MHPRTSTIEVFREEMKFAAGHFTIWSATQREKLHGHNFSVHCAITGRVNDNGLIADYDFYKHKLMARMRQWDEIFLLPGQSPHLQIREEGPNLYAHFGSEIIPFLRSDVLVLPVSNVSVEELSRLLLEELTGDLKQLAADQIDEVIIKVASAPGQLAASIWKRHA